MIWIPPRSTGNNAFNCATFRTGILPRWAAGLFALGTVLGPAAVLLPSEHKSLVAVPVGLALAWLGYALWSERRESAAIISESAQADMNGRDKERPDKFIESIK